MIHDLARYWAWTGGNVGALPLEALATLLAGVIFRRPLARLAAWFRREEIAEARAARRIAADLHLHLTGREHELAPPKGEE